MKLQMERGSVLDEVFPNDHHAALMPPQHMGFRSLLVALDGEPCCDQRVRLAARFAAAHGSHLIGVASAGHIELTSGLGAAARYIEAAADAKAEAVQHASRWVDRFRTICHAAGVASVEAAVHEGDPATTVLHHAHCADVAVIGQADPAGASYRDASRFVERVVMHNARPTMVIPCKGKFDGVGDKVLVAWDDSHGSARAVADALPLLRHAGRVHLRVWRRAGEGAERLVQDRLQSVQRWMTRQGVACDAVVEITRAHIGDAILEHAARLDVDLIVMGSYGHSRWTERLMGGATRTALARSKVPLLTSH